MAKYFYETKVKPPVNIRLFFQPAEAVSYTHLKVNSASCTQILISHFGIDYLINLGVAGSMKNDVFPVSYTHLLQLKFF